jgi:integrase/recombinase XerD
MRAAASWGWIDTNPAREYDRGVIPERREPIRLPTDEDTIALIGACPNDMLRALVRVLRGTGMRLEEAAGIERRNLDFTRKAIMLDRTKTSRPRAVPMSAQGRHTPGPASAPRMPLRVLARRGRALSQSE